MHLLSWFHMLREQCGRNVCCPERVKDMFGDQIMSDAEIAEARQSIQADVSSNLYGAEVAAFFRAGRG